MNKEIAEKWVTALRSGEYKQTKHYLRDTDGFCCLGVLCDLAVKEGVAVAVESDNERIIAYRAKTEPFTNGGELTEGIKEWAGLKDSCGDFIPTEVVSPPKHPTSGNPLNSLASMNDTGNLSFAEIADFIEKNAESL